MCVVPFKQIAQGTEGFYGDGLRKGRKSVYVRVYICMNTGLHKCEYVGLCMLV